MNRFSKYNDIDTVMNKAESSLVSVEREYQKHLKEEKIPDSLLVEIKDYLANLRSALDYLWHKIPGVSNSYFPIANSEADFANKTRGLDAKYTDILAKWQSYDEQSWIRYFNLFRNKNIHLTLIPQKRRETKEFSIKKDGTSITVEGCTFRGHISFGVSGVSVPIDEKTQFPVDVPGVNVKRIIWVDFLFDGSSISLNFPKGISVLPFLKSSFANARQIISEIEQLL